MCVCSLKFPTCNARAPCCHLWPIRLCSILPLSHKRNDIKKKNYWKWNAYFDFLNNSFLKHFSFSEELSEIRSNMCIYFHVEYWSFLSYFNKKISPHIFEKNLQISNFMKIRPVGAEFFHAEGQTDMTKLLITFRNFANAPKKRIQLEYSKRDSNPRLQF